MKKSELLQAIIVAVSAETEVTSKAILSKSRKEEVVDARHIVVRMLADHELYPSQIAELLGVTTRGITLILNEFNMRIKTRRLVGINYELAKKKLGMNYLADESERQ